MSAASIIPDGIRVNDNLEALSKSFCSYSRLEGEGR
jgi:hypothetical protein